MLAAPLLTPLDSGWTVRQVEPSPATGRLDQPLPAIVPGCVHLDLLAAGAIADPYRDFGEQAQSWIGETVWEYRTVITLDAHRLTEFGNHELVFDGLDTVATISLNGTEIGRTANMHRRYRFEVAALLSPGDNALSVVFAAPVPFAEREKARYGERPSPYPTPYPYIRKMASNFGWDWGPTLVTSGIWRPVWLHSWSTGRFVGLRPSITLTGPAENRLGHVDLRADVVGAPSSGWWVEIEIAGHRDRVDVDHCNDNPNEPVTVTASFDIPDVELWWPVGLGKARLYDLEVRLMDGDVVLDAKTCRVGFRRIELRSGPDEQGSSFGVAVNDRDVFARGVNWIPDDCFLPRVTPERYRERLAQAVDANVNLIRVWGGGVYESDAFYDLCDRFGLLVWQDFLFACAAYPEDEPLYSEVEAEARDNVARLMSHPSLAVWNGNNENIWGFWDWDWQELLAGASWGWSYYSDLLPRIVAELDPARPYWPGSPYSGRPDIHPNDPAHGATHIWDVWNERDYLDYQSYFPRFVAEFGFQGPANVSTLRAAVSDGDLSLGSPGMLHRQRAIGGNDKLSRWLTAHFGDSDERLADWHFLTQVNQARAVELGVRHFRSLSPMCRGAIVWQLNDCWPVISWSAVDHAGLRKPLWYSMRRAFSAELATFAVDRAGRLRVAAVNDGTEEWRPEITVARRDLHGDELASTVWTPAVGPGGTEYLDLPGWPPADPSAEFLTLEANGQSHWHFFAVDRQVPLPPADMTVAVAQGPDGVSVSVTAQSVVRDLTLRPDLLDPSAESDSAMVNLLPGRTHTFAVRTSVPAEHPGWLSAPVLRCTNEGG